ncbi:hypothetical protein WEI85_22195 [Actinomycetes bacterium KLBMP 9797]
MRWLFRAVMAVVAVVAMVFPAVPATAAADRWTPAPCFSGSIDEWTAKDTSWLRLSGVLNCAAPAGSSFGFARYESINVAVPGELYQDRVRPYQPVAPTPWMEEGNVLPVGATDFAICVLSDYEVRLGCVRVIRKALGGELIVTALPTNHPLVDRVTVFPAPRPSCGGCW